MLKAVKPKILLVDDNREFLNITREILERNTDYQVIPLAEGSRALQVARKENPDVIVLDVYMPDADGPSICRSLKKNKELKNIPVLFLTGVGTDPHFRARCLEDGGDDFLTKPANTQELIARLRVLLRIKHLQDELRQERDELELKVQERARELKEKETLAAIGKMVAGVAHEIRNPLGAISNSAAVLSRDLLLEGEDSKLMDIIVLESNRLRDTINDFLSFAHPHPCNFSPVDFKKLVEDVYMLAKRDNLCRAEVDLQIDIQKKLPKIEADRDRLYQILWNLIRNAMEAIKGKGRVKLVVKASAQNHRKGVAITVTDNGSGISKEDRKQIFEPFFTRKARGSGLGLAMVKSAVQMHDGDIKVKSNVDSGSSFRIWLPLNGKDSHE